GTFLASILANRLSAQDITGFTQFYFNPSLLNASYVGADDQPVITFSYRKQWAGINGSPTMINANLQTALANHVSLGVNLNSYKTGLLNTTSALFTGGYVVSLAEHQSLRFGLSVGLSSTKVDVNNITLATAGDPILTDLAKSTMQPIGNFGMSFHSKTF